MNFQTWYYQVARPAPCDETDPIQANRQVGRAMAQAVSRRLPVAVARVQTRVWSCGIL
jgi:hypothetical protein